MKVSRRDEEILNQMHRLFSELAELQSQLSDRTQQKTLEFSNENYSVNHCIRWGEIAISEVVDELE